MSVNLLNEQDLYGFFARLVFSDERVPTVASENLSEISFVENHQELIARCMVFQWMKHRLRAYLLNQTNVPFLSRVSSFDALLPQWAKNQLNDGQEIYRFREGGLHPGLRRNIEKVYHFLKQRAQQYVIKQLCVAMQQGTFVKIQPAYLKTGNQYRYFEETLCLAEIWEKVEENKKTHRFHRSEVKHAARGIEKIMDLSDGYYVVQILTGEARVFEAKYMNHCLYKSSFEAAIVDGRKRFYSIRDAKGEPHITIEVRDWAYLKNNIFEMVDVPDNRLEFAGGIIYEYQGKNNQQPLAKYLPYFQEFVLKGKLGFSKSSMRASGLIYQDSRYYNLFDLPKGFVVKGNVNITKMGLTQLPDMSTVTVEGDFYCGQNHLKTLKGAPLRVTGVFDCHDNELVSLEGGPREVGCGYFCGQNLLETLQGCPDKILGLLHCPDNRLVTIDYLPSDFTKAIMSGNSELEMRLSSFFSGQMLPEISAAALFKIRLKMHERVIERQTILHVSEKDRTR